MESCGQPSAAAELQDAVVGLTERRARMRQTFETMQRKLASLRDATDAAASRLHEPYVMDDLSGRRNLAHGDESPVSAHPSPVDPSAALLVQVASTSGSLKLAPPRSHFRRSYPSR